MSCQTYCSVATDLVKYQFPLKIMYLGFNLSLEMRKFIFCNMVPLTIYETSQNSQGIKQPAGFVKEKSEIL